MPTEKQQQASLETPAHRRRAARLAKLGLKLQRAKDGEEGVRVTEVDPDSAAAERGMQAGDVILDAGGKSVTRPEQIVEAFAAAKADGRKAVLLRVKSEHSRCASSLCLRARRPDPRLASDAPPRPTGRSPSRGSPACATPGPRAAGRLPLWPAAFHLPL